MALKVKNLENFIHVSTCYVNTDKFGWIEEKVYDSAEDAEKMMINLIKMHPVELEKTTKQILGFYPNTYVFTKAAVERILRKKRPTNFPLTIVRPSIIGGSLRYFLLFDNYF